MQKRLWDKGAELDKQVHDFTVGDDPVLDLELVEWDVLGSAAHAAMLRSTGVLTGQELTALQGALSRLLDTHRRGEFSIPRELEDCHTAIESFLAQEAGEAGLKIHTGRSRNDQVLLAMRLFLRRRTLETLEALDRCLEQCFARIDELGHQPMPGYTHLQPAMPSSFAMWLHAFAEAMLESYEDGLHLLSRLNVNPLGAASGFGSSLPLDRELTSRLLGFSRPQRSPIDVQNSRGRFELKYLRWLADIAGSIEKLAWDMILYSTREFGFISLPAALTTGSSIMPQKQNPDVLELLRGRAARIRGAESELHWVVAKLPGNYHRDFQYTKEPVIRGARNFTPLLPMIGVVIESFTVNPERLSAAMTDDLYATYDAYRGVQEGTPFREAYRATAAKIKQGGISKTELETDFGRIAAETDREIRAARDSFAAAHGRLESWRQQIAAAEQNVLSVKAV